MDEAPRPAAGGGLEREIAEAEPVRSDLAGLLGGARIATLFLDRELRVRVFTPAVADVFRLAGTDVGRPISEIPCLLDYADVARDAREVSERHEPIEREGVRADGRAYAILISPAQADSGVAGGVVLSFIDVTRLRQAEASERLFAAVVADSDDAVVVIDPDGRILTWNRGAERMYGYARDEALGCLFDDLLAPEGGGEAEVAELWHAGRGVRSVGATRRRKDGTLLEVSLTATPVRTGVGEVHAIATTERDVTQQKEREARLVFLLRELNHRARNTLAMIAALVGETAGSATSIDEFRTAIDARLGALSDIYHVLGREEWGSLSVAEVTGLALGSQAPPGRYEVTGHDRRVPPAIATPLFMALHELAVNAAKHGALSGPTGEVKVDIRVDAQDHTLEIVWRERGGPPVAPPRESGFGMTVIQRGLEYEAGGRTQLDFSPEGLEARLTVPLPIPHEVADDVRGDP